MARPVLAVENPGNGNERRRGSGRRKGAPTIGGVLHNALIPYGETVAVSAVSFFGRSREYAAGAIGHASAGYEFASGSGLVVRPTATYFYGNDSGVWWPGIMIGYRF
jgi:hypothetical protein